ncbi:hypothetical protein SAMN06264364_11671 [Quadrisphaera granulorum]|uniref:Uncharacterized protein n=1 Tax=Quadrisphaera granulorum TaxID=317664 RepID=A0A316A5G6_9ACTN|nr:hypothetical protein [Quadrisphaera granulorum]PWJ52935.1 hypothetical protein BXY45_11671 [Quadrisphaera granulorum]SZE97317.1 hypothetical protein SAMN06264364_11671 [Quadrisphaera granulorum]
MAVEVTSTMSGLLDARTRAAVAVLAAVNDPRSEGDERLRRRERVLHQLAMERQRKQRRLSRSA